MFLLLRPRNYSIARLRALNGAHKKLNVHRTRRKKDKAALKMLTTHHRPGHSAQATNKGPPW